MTAGDRLWTALKRLSEAAPVDLAGLIDDVSAAVDDARLAEREAIVIYLRDRLRHPGVVDAWTTLDDAVDAVERGEHVEARS